MRYFDGKSKIAKQISDYINNLGGVLTYSTSEVNKELLHKFQTSLTPHTHTHTM